MSASPSSNLLLPVSNITVPCVFLLLVTHAGKWTMAWKQSICSVHFVFSLLLGIKFLWWLLFSAGKQFFPYIFPRILLSYSRIANQYQLMSNPFIRHLDSPACYVTYSILIFKYSLLFYHCIQWASSIYYCLSSWFYFHFLL